MNRKLRINKETLRILDQEKLEQVQGGKGVGGPTVGLQSCAAPCNTTGFTQPR